jgi:hypothetical protein
MDQVPLRSAAEANIARWRGTDVGRDDVWACNGDNALAPPEKGWIQSRTSAFAVGGAAATPGSDTSIF